ncbi:MAG: glucosaminidase domain-containing protein [Paludibacteraceae bacterium]|nr:glucosaminidase domain-containing protein [Paludibacteraceae bacterium]
MKRIKYIFYVLGSMFMFQTALSQSYRSAETIAYIEQYHKVAIREMYKYSIPASITLAQGILESGSGRSDLSTIANNHFGIKCTSDYTGKHFLKDDNKKDDCFRVYEHAEGSYRDHSLFLTTRKHYSSLFKLSITDYKGWANGLKAAGYATNPKYPSLLIAVIEQNKLYEYDRNPEKYLTKKDAENLTLDDQSQPQQKTEGPIQNEEPKIIDGKLNGTTCVVVKSGDTFYGLSRRHGISIDKLRYFNNFPEDYVLKAGEYLFLERKQRKNPDYPTYTVKKGDTLLSICQKFGVRRYGVRRHNNMEKGEEVKEGQVLILNW